MPHYTHLHTYGTVSESESSNEHYYDSNTYERKPARITTWKGYYYQEVTNDREDITKEASQGDAVLIFEEDGTETWSGSQTKEHDINRDYKETTINIDSVSEGKTDRDSDGIQEAYTKRAGSITEEHTREANRGKTEHQLQIDGTLDDGKDVLDSSVKAFEMEKHEKKGNTVFETWEENSNPSSGENVTEKWTHRHISGGSDRGFTKWSTSTTSYSEYFDKAEVTETTSTYDYERSVDTDTEISSETKRSTSTNSSGKSQTKIVTPSGSGTLNTEEWADKFTTSESKYHHASDGTRTTQHESTTAPYDETIYLKTKTKSDWDWDYERVTKLESKESQKREPGSDTAKAKIDREWEMTIDYTGVWNREQNINSTGATDGSTMNVENKSREETTIEGDATVTYTADFDISGLNDDDNPPVVTPVGDPQPVSIWTWVEDWSASTSSTGEAHIVKYSPTYEWDEDTQQEIEIWEDRTFTGSTSSSESRKFTTSNENVQGTESFTPGPFSNDMEDADFLGPYMEAYPEIYNGGVPYENGSETVDFQHFASEISFQEQIPQEYLTNEFVSFEFPDPSWLDQLTIGINDAFQNYFPELTGFLLGFPLEWEATASFTSDLFRQLDDGTMADRTFGLIDGFLDGINPFNHWVSIPDIGPVYGHVEDYAFSKTVGTFAGIGTSIAISFMGPGLVHCGTLAHKTLLVWEGAGAVGSIGGAVTNIIETGEVGVMDVLGIVGGVASIGSVKSLMNKCFVGDTGVAREFVTLTEATPSSSETSGTVWIVTGIGLAIAGGLLKDKRKRSRHVPDPYANYFATKDYWDDWDNLKDTKHPAQRQAEHTALLTNEALGDNVETMSMPVSSSKSAVESISVHPKPKPPTTTSPRRLHRLLWVVPLLLASFCFWQGFSRQGQAVAPQERIELRTTPIREMRNGMRVLAENPELADLPIEALQIEDPSQWRNVRLLMTKPDGSLLKISLLRELEWLELNEAEVGSIVELDLAELGAAGPAEVIEIEPCPAIEPGDRPLVTGTFEHTAANVVDLKVESEAAPIGTTDNHPFWSEDRKAFVPAGELKIGETLRLADGRTTRVTGMTPRAGQHTVYNLEVDSQHVYYVGNSGVLVHNTCDISLGLGEHLDEFTDSVRNTVNKPVEIFPFNSLTKPTDGPWDGVVRAMHSADNIHFNMQGMSKEVFQAWMKNGGHLSTPYMGGKGWTNRELYEILTNPELMAKTQFHNLIGSLDDWLVKP